MSVVDGDIIINADGDIAVEVQNALVLPVPASQVTGLARSATIDTTNAANITSGVLDPARIPANLSKTLHVYGIGGQSNAQGQSGDLSLSPIVPSGKVLSWNGAAIVDANDPVGANPSSAWPAFGITHYEATGVPVLLVPAALGGTDQSALTGVNPSNWDGTNGTLAPALIAAMNAGITAARAAGYNPIVKGILWSQGENDAAVIDQTANLTAGGSTLVTTGVGAGGSSIVVSDATGLVINEFVYITLDNTTVYTTGLVNVVGTTLTLATHVPPGRSIVSNVSILTVYTQNDYKAAFRRMAAYYRSATIDGATFPQLPIYVSLTGGPQTGDTYGFQKIRQAQDQIAQSDEYTKIVFRGAVGFIARGMMQAGSLHYLQEGYNEMGREMAKGVVAAQAGDGWLHETNNVYRVAVGGTLRNGDVLTIRVASSAIANSPWVVTTSVVLPGDTFPLLASQVFTNATTFSPTLMQAGIDVTYTATGSGFVITFSQPPQLLPQAVVTASWSGGATETVSVTTGATPYGWAQGLFYNRGAITVGAATSGPDVLNVVSNPALGRYAFGLSNTVLGSADNNLLRLVNTNASAIAGSRVGCVFQPGRDSPGIGENFGAAIIAEFDAITGRSNFFFGGYEGTTTFAESGRFAYTGGFSVGTFTNAPTGWIDSLHGYKVAGSQIGINNLANIAANTLAGNNTNAPATPVALTASQTQALLQTGLMMSLPVTVNLNVAGDNALNVVLPTGFTTFRVQGLIIQGVTGNPSTATFGVYTGAGATGGVIVISPAAISVTSATVNGNNNGQFVVAVNAGTELYTPDGSSNVYFRVAATVAATVKVMIYYQPTP